MNILEHIKSSFKNVFSNKIRALLTMLGIIIGIGSVITIMSIGSGAAASMMERFQEMGVGRLTIYNQSGRNLSASDVLTMRDYELLAGSNLVKRISPVYSYSANVKLLDPAKSKSASLMGVNGDYKDITNPTLLHGRYVTANDVDLALNVVVIDDTTAEKIFGTSDESVLGEKISIKTGSGTLKFTVAGITKNTEAATQALADDQYPENIVMPVSTLQRLAGTKQLSSITLMVKDANAINEAAATLAYMLDDFHGTTDKYYVQNFSGYLDEMNSSMGIMTLTISCVAGISLLVGGIGVMNIMLVTVTERTREIGVRKSLGARRFDIQFQFLIESVILTAIGGAFGMLLGWSASKLAGHLLDINAAVTPLSVIIAVSISSAIGIIFGVYPAAKAARLDPIMALRYE